MLALFAVACGDDSSTSTGSSTEEVASTTTGGDMAEETPTTMAEETPTTMAADDMAEETSTTMAADAMPEMDHLGDGSLGTIVVEPGAEVQIRSLNAITGDTANFGLPIARSIEIAVEDYGDVHGFGINLGDGLDDLCSADGGQAAAQTIVADEQIAGVVGTSCSGAAVAAAPLISAAGIVMISGGNTSPALTSDLAGTAGESFNEGYYRTAHNDLYQGRAMALFVFNDLGLSTAAAIHDGDPYTQGLAQAFVDAYEELGGTITGFAGIAKGDTDMVPVLTEVAAANPEALFFPIFQPEGDFIAAQAPGVPGLEDTQLLAADGLLVKQYLELPETEGIYFSGPDARFGENVNESTGQSANDVTAAYAADFGEEPTSPFWAHGYDATALLLDAIAAASAIDGDGNLVIDKAGVREFLYGVQNYSGLIGLINCDDFGDCGSQKVTVIHNDDSSDFDASKANVVFEYAP
ncbi:MAG: branched-chain amino acid ABC transporter substrate-binding protein [Acidimicrobiaceae bacterium]|nr:branched-chain amino acid ABC transporter substrate-binding protein [Acidimicrobiia bacterium]MCY4493921.1 branched-chain amino acid ABC transporter substrate-binding protein [Acidimicrobiaceae bacterium]